MEDEQEVAPVTPKKKGDKSSSPSEGPTNKKCESPSDAEDPKPRIVLTFRSEKPGAKSSTMKIVPPDEKQEESRVTPRRLRKQRRMSDETEIALAQSLQESLDKKKKVMTPKRLTRRRSREFDVVASAIARKEKSYNETVPTRPSRRIKPTAKVLANEELRLESQNSTRLGALSEKSPEEGVRTRRSMRSGRQNVQEESPQKKEVTESLIEEEEEEEEDSQNQVMKLKHLCELGLKAIDPDEETDAKEDEGEAEVDESEPIEIDDEGTEDEEIDDDTEVINKLLEADLDSNSGTEFSGDSDYSPAKDASSRPRSSRRLHEKSSGMNDKDRSSPAPADEVDDDGVPRRRSKRKRVSVNYQDYADLAAMRAEIEKMEDEAEPEETSEPAAAEEGSETACTPENIVPIAVCTCETVSNVHAAPDELTEPVFCQAIELVDGVRVGCSHGAARAAGGHAALLRAGLRAPYFLACPLHTQQLKKHMCCPACGLFCTQGIFYQCSLGHLFHLDCGLPYNDAKAAPGCPHCGMWSYRWKPVNTDCVRVKVDMHCSNKRIFLPHQREQCTPAYLSFSTLDPAQVDHGPVIPEDLLPSPAVDLERLCEKPDMEEDPAEAAAALCDAILAGETAEQLIPKILSSAVNTLASPLGCSGAGAAARAGRLPALHLLRAAGADLDRAAGGKTPLMLAVLALLEKSENKSPKKSKLKSDKEEDMETDHTKEESEEKDAAKEESIEESEIKKSKVESRAKDEDLMKVIRYLVIAGCDVNLPGPDGMTALHMAAQNGGAAVCRVLLAAGAEPDLRDQGGWTPLVWAAEHGHHEVVRVLLSHGADASATDHEGNAVVHWCALAGAARCLQLLLDAAPQAVGAFNAHTDTPLHVAARQGHYACVIILLTRGAKTDVENSAGEMPADVCGGQCRLAIALNAHMAAAAQERHVKILSSDISLGRERLPLPCVNEVDDEPLPADFKYVTSHVMPQPLSIDNTLQTLQGCTCTDLDCSSANCGCCVLGVRRWWRRGVLAPDFPFHAPPMLFECNQTCACHAKKCTNSVITRLSQTGSVFVPASVFRAGGARGWGLRARGALPRGAPAAAYVGELLALADADTRSQDQYMFALDVKQDLLEQCTDKTVLCVDAAAYGGAARFINHSCRPSLLPVRVFTHTRDLRLPTIALFALRDIQPGEELTFDYGEKFWSVKSKWMRCECGAPDCRYPAKSDDSDS